MLQIMTTVTVHYPGGGSLRSRDRNVCIWPDYLLHNLLFSILTYFWDETCFLHRLQIQKPSSNIQRRQHQRDQRRRKWVNVLQIMYNIRWLNQSWHFVRLTIQVYTYSIYCIVRLYLSCCCFYTVYSEFEELLGAIYFTCCIVIIVVVFITNVLAPFSK